MPEHVNLYMLRHFLESDKAFRFGGETHFFEEITYKLGF